MSESRKKSKISFISTTVGAKSVAVDVVTIQHIRIVSPPQKKKRKRKKKIIILLLGTAGFNSFYTNVKQTDHYPWMLTQNEWQMITVLMVVGKAALC